MKHLKYILLVITLSIFVISCGPSTTSGIEGKPALQQEISSIELERFIKNSNSVAADTFLFADATYTLVDEEWFKKNVLNKFNEFLVKNGVSSASVEKNDCDDFSRAFSFFVRVKSNQSNFIKYDISGGELYYRTLDMGHAINIAVVLDKNGNKKLLFIEPQGPSLVNLDDEYKKFYVIYVGM